MMAAAQPFISGAISKTVNLPNESTVEEIGACYQLSWELGIKANALYRDGCKLSQPLSTKSEASDHAEEEDLEGLETAEESQIAVMALEPRIIEVERIVERVVERVVERIIERPMRRRLLDTRHSITHKFNVGGHEGYLIVGLYEDGRPGELFITMAKEGSTIGGLMDSLGTAISVALQYGVPVESLVTKFAHQRFEPMGITTNSDIPFAKSLVDYIFRWFGMQFIQGYRDANSPRRISAGSHSSDDFSQLDTSQLDHSSISKPMNASPHSPSATTPTPEPTQWSSNRFTTNLDSSTKQSDASGQSTNRSPGVEKIVDVSLSARITTIPLSDDSMRAGESSMNPIQPIIVEHGEMRTLGSPAGSAADQANAQLMGDAPACDVCGAITVRNGTCYRCWNCGHSMGCS